jgi:hypothetical protein
MVLSHESLRIDSLSESTARELFIQTYRELYSRLENDQLLNSFVDSVPCRTGMTCGMNTAWIGILNLRKQVYFRGLSMRLYETVLSHTDGHGANKTILSP